MKTTIIASLLALSGLVWTGCSTVNSRIKEKSAVYYSLSQEDREKIDKGIIDPGFTTDMVYIALGKPDEKRAHRDSDGSGETWIYNTYYEQYAGQETVGYRRWVTIDPVTHVYHVYYEPVTGPVYSEQRDEKIRVTFRDGRVTSVEQSRESV